jgi:hypothetical protein
MRYFIASLCDFVPSLRPLCALAKTILFDPIVNGQPLDLKLTKTGQCSLLSMLTLDPEMSVGTEDTIKIFNCKTTHNSGCINNSTLTQS